jgi:hypothetical protein
VNDRLARRDLYIRMVGGRTGNLFDFLLVDAETDFFAHQSSLYHFLRNGDPEFIRRRDADIRPHCVGADRH